MTSRAAIEILRPGALTSVQDLGRPGFESSGVPRGGAFDRGAARLANRLVGNPDDAALLELTLLGPTLRCASPATLALVGGGFEIQVDKRVIESSTPFEVGAGSVVEIGRGLAGARAWLAVAGGLDVPKVLGSRSTDLSAGFGGLDGRALRAGDLLQGAEREKRGAPSIPAAAIDRASAKPGGVVRLRVLSGPDADLVDPRSAAILATRIWKVDPRSDRRGVRFEGEPLALPSHAPLRSIPMLPGAVELTPEGLPIVLGVDAPVTGGYPWIAQTIEADLGRLAQLRPGDEARFEPVDFAAAERASAELEASFVETVRPR